MEPILDLELSTRPLQNQEHEHDPSLMLPCLHLHALSPQVVRFSRLVFTLRLSLGPSLSWVSLSDLHNKIFHYVVVVSLCALE